MDKPKTNHAALELVFTITKTQSALAKHLGLVRQYVSRWDEVPTQFAVQTSEIANISVDWVLPELEAKAETILGHPIEPEQLKALIRAFCRPPKGEKWPKAARKRRRATGAK